MFEQKKRALFFHKKLQFYLKPILIISLIFVLYQLIMFIQLTKEVKKEVKLNLILGTHELQKQFYTPNNNDEFICIVSMERIDFQQVNDNYCDCLDGSDEPGTNACSNGQFYCSLQAKYLHYPKFIPSSKVNDGICDCCDGSDEWMRRKLPSRLSAHLQDVLKRYQSPCPNLCGH